MMKTGSSGEFEVELEYGQYRRARRSGHWQTGNIVYSRRHLRIEKKVNCIQQYHLKG